MSPSTTKIRISTLRAASERLLGDLEARGITEVDVDADYYWFVPAAALHVLESEPKEFTMGQLSDDLTEIEKIARDDDAPRVPYALVWLAALLRAVGERVVG